MLHTESFRLRSARRANPKDVRVKVESVTIEVLLLVCGPLEQLVSVLISQLVRLARSSVDPGQGADAFKLDLLLQVFRALLALDRRHCLPLDVLSVHNLALLDFVAQPPLVYLPLHEVQVIEDFLLPLLA